MLLLACATPSERARDEALALGYTRKIVHGKDFPLVVYQSQSRRRARLHVYLEGDASPLRTIRTRPLDPTPNEPLMLRLMAHDPGDALYLGRPCQHGASPCPRELWTTARFGEPVVASLADALASLRRERGDPEVVLLGYSGGGALAMLLAERAPGVRAVVTLAGNLDVGAWAAHHGFTPLRGSLDPAQRPPLPAHIRQLHVRGEGDVRVPPFLTEAVIARQPAAVRMLVPGVDHRCCWDGVWPAVLAELDRMLDGRAARGARAAVSKRERMD